MADGRTTPRAPRSEAAPRADRRRPTSTLDEFQWQNRLVVVFADTPRDPAFIRQIELLADRPEALAERDVRGPDRYRPRRRSRRSAPRCGRAASRW